MGKNKLRAAIRELWALGPNGSRLDKRKAIKKIVYAVERQERIMLHKLDWEEVEDGDEFPEIGGGLDVAEGLELAEQLAAEAEAVTVSLPATEAPDKSRTRLQAEELRAAGKSNTAIAREIFEIDHPSRFHLNKVRQMIGDNPAEATVNPKRTYTRRNGTALSTAVPQEAISQEIEPKRQPARRKQVALRQAQDAALANDEGGMVPLTPDQVSKLWGAITGGSIRITTDGSGRVTCEVSESSFKKALPVLLDRL